jgi:hypothetical protein
MTAFILALAVPTRGQQQIYINQPGQAPIVGQTEESGNMLLFDLEKNKPVYWGSVKGTKPTCIPWEDRVWPLLPNRGLVLIPKKERGRAGGSGHAKMGSM